MSDINKLPSTKIIAEIGVNHNGNIDNAFKLIYSAKTLGADAVKFQTFSAETLANKNTPKVAYQHRDFSSDSHFEMLKKLELSFDQHYVLKSYCDDLGIEFISTPYDLDSAKFLVEYLNIKTIKTASANLDDVFMHRYLAKQKDLNILIATGMSMLSDVETTLSWYLDFKSTTNLTLLHCVSAYPCSYKAINLSSLIQLKDLFNCEVGLSDHSEDALSATMSVALGAKVIERHFTLDKNDIGPDHFASSTPDEFCKYIKNIRDAEIIMGGEEKKIMPEEEEMFKVSKKSVALKVSKKKGDKLREEDLILLRPNIGIPASCALEIVGSELNRDVNSLEHIHYEDLI